MCVRPDRPCAVLHCAEADADDVVAAANGDAAMDDALAADMAVAGAVPADEVASDDSGTATEEDATRPVLEPAVRDATAQIIVRLAGSALSSKVRYTPAIKRENWAWQFPMEPSS